MEKLKSQGFHRNNHLYCSTLNDTVSYYHFFLNDLTNKRSLKFTLYRLPGWGKTQKRPLQEASEACEK